MRQLKDGAVTSVQSGFIHAAPVLKKKKKSRQDILRQRLCNINHHMICYDQYLLTVERKNSLLTGRNLLQNEGTGERQPSATIDRLGDGKEEIREHGERGPHTHTIVYVLYKY